MQRESRLSGVPGSGGFKVTPRMQALLDKAGDRGFLASKNGGQELRDLYAQHSLGFHFTLLNHFAALCYCGQLDEIIEFMGSGKAPPLNCTETPYKFGYAALVVAGSQRMVVGPPGSCRHVETLKFLFEKGCPPDVPDICRYTALEHASMVRSGKPEIIRTILAHGADVNHKDIYGMAAVTGAIMAGHTDAVDLLMEHGADLTAPDADGIKPEKIFVNWGPQITAVIQRWLRKRAGEQAPMTDRKCAACSKVAGEGTKLKHCAACHSVLYCSTACQRSHWKAHKRSCQPFSASNVITLKPSYDNSNYGSLMPMAPFTRHVAGYATELPTERQQRYSHRASSYPKNLLIKIQVPIDSYTESLPSASQGNLLVYTKKRDFVCQIARGDAPAAYDRVCEVVKSKGVRGLKGYFAAELRSEDELVVKVGEILAEQPF